MTFFDTNNRSLHKIRRIITAAKFDIFYLAGTHWFVIFEQLHTHLSPANIQCSYKLFQLIISAIDKFWSVFVTPTLCNRERCLKEFYWYISLKLLLWIVNELALSKKIYSYDCKIEVKPQISRSIFLTRVYSVFLGFSLKIGVSSFGHDAEFYQSICSYKSIHHDSD